MTPGSHHMILFLTGTAQQPDGTMTEANCGLGGGAQNLPIWTYAAQATPFETDLPADDGTGKPVGMEVPANQAAYVQMHYLNTTDAPLMAHVHLQAFAYPQGTAFTKTAAYVTYNESLTIPAHAVNLLQTMTCNVDPTAKFWTISTHSHKQSVATDVKDGTSTVFSSTDWEHPGAAAWNPGFYSFASGKLTYECTYTNDGDNANNQIVSGNSAATNEMCMAVGYYFPATTPHICLNNFVVQ